MACKAKALLDPLCSEITSCSQLRASCVATYHKPFYRLNEVYSRRETLVSPGWETISSLEALFSDRLVSICVDIEWPSLSRVLVFALRVMWKTRSNKQAEENYIREVIGGNTVYRVVIYHYRFTERKLSKRLPKWQLTDITFYLYCRLSSLDCSKDENTHGNLLLFSISAFQNEAGTFIQYRFGNRLHNLNYGSVYLSFNFTNYLTDAMFK